ncbi:hypothetical protein PV04_05695 [Phialophora macrospora]|uniref:Uncharacterized protein n=1 Tax=Phialophora macrospora TaxID=1851006 RepID=A0A0D2G2L2_9EURO|nr:hypothetical protein PV04_05695 [Phialophora macrospora]
MSLDAERIGVCFCLWPSEEHDTSQMLKRKITSTQYVQALSIPHQSPSHVSTEACTSRFLPGVLEDTIHRHHTQQERSKLKTLGRKGHPDQRISNKKRRTRLPPPKMPSASPFSQETVTGPLNDTEGPFTGSRFLNLPLEVRRNLYSLMVGLPCRDHLNLLCVHKQVYREARESFYRRPLYCDSQYDLMKFVELWPQSVLQSITNLRLRLEEIRPEIMQRYLHEIPSGNPVQANPHPYLVEINQITSALSELPRIAHLQLLRPSSLQISIPSSIVTTQLLNWTAEHYPKLHSLRLDAEQCHIGCLGSLTDLKSLQLTGYSETGSIRTADVLSKLTNLEKLVVVGPPPGLQMLQRHGSQTKIVQSVTHQTFERLTPLKSLTLVQLTDSGTDGDVLLTRKTMKALYEVHRESLRSLTISSTANPSSAFVEYLSAFLLGTTNMQEVRLMWPGVETSFVDCIPNTIGKLEVAVTSRDNAQAIIDRLLLMEYRLKHLRYIKFHIINPVHETPADDKEGPLAFSLPIQHLDADIESPFKISWGIWQPMLSE